MFRALERKLRYYRDRKLIEPLMRTRFFQKHMQTNDDAVVLNFGDHCIAFDPNDVAADLLRKERGLSKDMTFRVFDTLPTRRGVFVEVGANIGTQTVYALKFGGFARAVCFEPHPKNAWLWRLNMAINGLSDRATLIEAAAGSEPDSASMSVAHRSGGTHSLAVDHHKDTITVPVVPVEQKLRELGIAQSDIGLAWVDVEGYEGEVLKGWPSLPGTPLCIEYSPDVRVLPAGTFSGWSRWSETGNPIHWRPISELDPTSYASQVDFLLQ